MGFNFAAALSGFVSGYTKVKDSKNKQHYYDALIQQGQQKIGLQQQSLDQRAQQLRNSNSMAGGRLAEQTRHNKVMEGLASGRANKTRGDDLSQPPPGSGGTGGYFDSNQGTGAVPADSPDANAPTTAPPGVPDTSSPDNVSLSNPEGRAYAQSDEDDLEDDDTEDYAQGGAIGYASGGQLDPGLANIKPPPMTAAAPMMRPAPVAPTQAVATSAPEPIYKPQAAPAPTTNGPDSINPQQMQASSRFASNPAFQQLEAANPGQLQQFETLGYAEGGEVEDANESAYDTGKKAERDVSTDANESAYDTGKKAERKPKDKSESPYQNPTADANESAYDEGGPSRSKEDSGYLQGSGKGAVDTEGAPEETPTATSEPRGGATTTNGGFDQAKVLQQWGVNPETNPLHLGLTEIAQGERHKQTGAVPAQQGQPTIGEGVDAPSHKQMQTMAHIVDPDGELSKSARRVAVLNAWVGHYVAAGDIQKAQKVAGGVLAYSARQAQMYGDAAVKAIQSGHMDAAVDMIQHAYDQLPDGQSFRAHVLPDGQVHAYSVNANGEEKELGTFGPQQVLKLATGVANGSEFWKQTVATASGIRGIVQANQPGKPPKAEALPKAPNYNEQSKFGEDLTRVGKGENDQDTTGIPQGYRPEMESSASAIHNANPGMPPQHAMAWANSISNPEKAEGGTAVKLQPSPTNPNIFIATNQLGQQIKMDRNTALGLIAMRNNRRGDVYKAGAKEGEEISRGVNQAAVETEDRENKTTALKALNRAKAIKRGEDPDKEYDPNAKENQTAVGGPM